MYIIRGNFLVILLPLVILVHFSTFIFCLSDVGFNDAFILHLMHILGKFCLAAPLCLESEFALMFVAVVGLTVLLVLCSGVGGLRSAKNSSN